MSAFVRCDVCEKEIREANFVVQERTGQWSFDYDSWDICSVQCLAVGAVKIARREGGREEHEAVMSKVNNAPEKFRKWWNR